MNLGYDFFYSSFFSRATVGRRKSGYFSFIKHFGSIILTQCVQRGKTETLKINGNWLSFLVRRIRARCPIKSQQRVRANSRARALDDGSKGGQKGVIGASASWQIDKRYILSSNVNNYFQFLKVSVNLFSGFVALGAGKNSFIFERLRDIFLLDVFLCGLCLSLVFWNPCGLLIGRFAVSNEKRDKIRHVTVEKILDFLLHSPHQVDRDANKGDEHAADADHSQHPRIQLRVVWKMKWYSMTKRKWRLEFFYIHICDVCLVFLPSMQCGQEVAE